MDCAATVLLAGCGGGDLCCQEGHGTQRVVPRTATTRRPPGLFGEGGFTLGKLASGEPVRRRGRDEGSATPVNRFLWQASLDTLSVHAAGIDRPVHRRHRDRLVVDRRRARASASR